MLVQQDDRPAKLPEQRGDDTAEHAAQRRAVDRHFATFWRLVARADALLRQGRDDAAAVYAAIAAKYAASHHPGLFASPELEQLLHTIGSRSVRQVTDRSPRQRPDGLPHHVLHVFTQVARVGGHTRMVWRWIREDAGRTHSVAITRQGAVLVPRALREAVAATGGWLDVLDERRGNVLTWAGTLRALSASADLVVLHINPDDVIPPLAFGDKAATPPVIFIDHADQLFWLGIGCSDVVVALRESGQRLALSRRGVAPERSVLLPIPLAPAQSALARAEARARLGLAEDAIVLLSIARPHKYLPVSDDEGFAAALVPLLQQYPQAVALVVGPDQAGPWVGAAARTGGRVRALGLRDDTAPFYRAADIYLDSYPVVSITSLLEAGGHGLPLVSRLPPLDAPGVLGADTPGLGHLVRARGAAEFRAAVARLIADPEHRTWLGEATRRAIAAAHTGAGWQRALEALYRQALMVPPIAAPPEPDDRQRRDEVDRLLPCLFSGEPPLEAIVRFHLRLLPPDLRLRAWAAQLATWPPARPGLLLPEWFGTRLERWQSDRRGYAPRLARGAP